MSQVAVEPSASPRLVAAEGIASTHSSYVGKARR